MVCPWVVTSLMLSSCANKMDAEGSKTGNLVARQDYEVSKSWAPKKVMGKDFWNTLQPMHLHPKYQSSMKAINEMPMVKEAAILHFLEGLTGETSNEIQSSTLDDIGKKYVGVTPNVPVFTHMTADHPPYRCMRKIDFDQKAYEVWKAKYPNFMGFMVGEWDNQFLSVLRGNTLALLEKAKASQEVIDNVTRELPKPKDRKEAVAELAKCHTAVGKYYFNDPSKLDFLRGGWCYDHYALEWGADMAWLETTNTGPYRHQVSISFIRGASHQYDRKWFIALFYNGCDDKGKFTPDAVPDFLRHNDKGESGTNRGMSVSMYMRDMYLAYLNGATFVNHEGWMDALVSDEHPDAWSLSPYGEAMKEWYEFTKRNPRGISYAPVALLVPFEQGYPNWGGRPWSAFPYERPDAMIDAFMYTIVPYTGDPKKGAEGCLANSPYGDIFDVVMPNAPKNPVSKNALSNYKVAIALGKYDWDQAVVDRLVDYVRKGGTLVLNIKQINQFFPAAFTGLERIEGNMPVASPLRSTLSSESTTLTEEHECEKVKLGTAVPFIVDAAGVPLACVNNYGNGHVIVATVDHAISKRELPSDPEKLAQEMAAGREFPLIAMLLRQLVREVLPLEVKGDIEYGLGKTADGWLLYLINNKGVTKFTNTRQELDTAKTAKVEVMLKDIKTMGVEELRAGKAIQIDNAVNSFTINVAPGDVRILKIKTSGL